MGNAAIADPSPQNPPTHTPVTSSASLHDSDGDGIPDTWEENGYDANNDGVAELDFPAWGANPHKKDIFVEADYLPHMLPSQEALDLAVDTFAHYPLNNPDGSVGINLHIDAGSVYPKYDLGGGEELPNYQIANEQTVGSLRAQHSNSVRNGIFHYMVFGDYYTDAPGSSGIAQINGLNFAVTLGPTYWANKPTSRTYAATFIHELGHNLGLHHGGNDDINFKPNYFSIMNYRYQLQGVPRTDGSTYLGYSTQTYNTLEENNLNEVEGFGPQSHGFLYDYAQAAVADRPVDFNGNGQIDEEAVQADLNNDGGLSSLNAPNDMQLLNFQARPEIYEDSAVPQSPQVVHEELTPELAVHENLF